MQIRDFLSKIYSRLELGSGYKQIMYKTRHTGEDLSHRRFGDFCKVDRQYCTNLIKSGAEEK